MSSGRSHTAVAIALILFGIAGSVGLTRYLERVRPPMPQGYEDQDLALQASKLRGFVFGAEGLIADWYWMNSLQYIGGKISSVSLSRVNLDDLSALNPRLLYPYLNTTVELDPRFIPAYSYGAIVLPAVDVDQAVALTEKGIANNPNEWRLYQYLGYIYWKEKDYERASEVYSRGAQIPGAPDFLRMMAASMKSRGGDRETSRAMYQGMLDEADSDGVRESVQLRLFEIDSMDELDAINIVLADLQKTNGSCPSRLADLIPRLQEVKLPRDRSFSVTPQNELADPTGHPYRLDEKACKAQLAYESKIPISP